MRQDQWHMHVSGYPGPCFDGEAGSWEVLCMAMVGSGTSPCTAEPPEAHALHARILYYLTLYSICSMSMKMNKVVWKIRRYAPGKGSFASPTRRYATMTSHRFLLDHQDSKSIVLPFLDGEGLKLLRSPLSPSHQSSILLITFYFI